ncbi:MAG: DUF559 domain-containing protein [candidate division Zixibacteria bacterium]|nr:DUF559 domain-containing protein [candidate division Zixibacteria bacterium]MCI0595027.1 DUF559 domain-containing protein [candidate division Zixibacteria bacterium]
MDDEIRKEFFLKYPKESIPRARGLRKRMTAAERKLWSILRSNQLGAHFRRQVPIGPFVVDFLSIKNKLVIELDGGQHFEAKGISKDLERDAFLKGKGLTILRFSDRDCLINPEGVVQIICGHINAKG